MTPFPFYRRHCRIQNRLTRQHPGLFAALRGAAPPCPLGDRGIETCDGWDALVESLCIQLRRRELLGDPPILFLQLKEKMGLLRVYVSRPASDAQIEVIRRFDAYSGEVCWVCGAVCMPPHGRNIHDGACGLHGGASVDPSPGALAAMTSLAERLERSPRAVDHAFANWLRDAAPSFRVPLCVSTEAGPQTRFCFEGYPKFLRGLLLDDGSIAADIKRNGRTVHALLSTDMWKKADLETATLQKRRTHDEVTTGHDQKAVVEDFEILLHWVNTRLSTSTHLGVIDMPRQSTAAGLYSDLVDLHEDLGASASVIDLPWPKTGWLD